MRLVLKEGRILLLHTCSLENIITTVSSLGKGYEGREQAPFLEETRATTCRQGLLDLVCPETRVWEKDL